MWAADIPHVNYLQFPNVDRLSFQEKRSGKRGSGGPPAFQKGLLRGLPVWPIPGRRQLFLGGPPPFPISPPGQEQGKGTPTAIPWPPLDPSRGDLRQPREALHTEQPGPGCGRGWGRESGLQQEPRPEALVGAWEGGRPDIYWPLDVSFPTNLYFCCSPEQGHMMELADLGS